MKKCNFLKRHRKYRCTGEKWFGYTFRKGNMLHDDGYLDKLINRSLVRTEHTL